MSTELHGLPAGIIDGGTAYLAERCRVLAAELEAARAEAAGLRGALAETESQRDCLLAERAETLSRMAEDVHGLKRSSVATRAQADQADAVVREALRSAEDALATADRLAAENAALRAALASCRHVLEDAAADCSACGRVACRNTALILHGVLSRLPAAGEAL